MEFFKIDGSYGEGGGQILRSAVTLSCITKTPIRIENIRHNRQNPGLGAQHLTAMKILSKICNAQVSGLKIGSTEIEFSPGDIKDLEISEDIGTAGSISLILQVLIYAVSLCKKNLKLLIKGGTDVPWSPTMDYTRYVLRDALASFGIKYSLEIKKRGYYPKGGGVIDLEVFPCEKISPISFTNKTTKDVSLVCTYSDIEERKIQTEFTNIENDFIKNGYNVKTKISEQSAANMGAAILAYSKDENSISGVDSLWSLQKGFGESFSKRFMSNSLGVDENLADMLIVPASQSKETSVFRVAKITKHLQTNLYITSKITGCKYGIGKISDGYEVRIKGS